MAKLVQFPDPRLMHVRLQPVLVILQHRVGLVERAVSLLLEENWIVVLVVNSLSGIHGEGVAIVVDVLLLAIEGVQYLGHPRSFLVFVVVLLLDSHLLDI